MLLSYRKLAINLLTIACCLSFMSQQETMAETAPSACSMQQLSLCKTNSKLIDKSKLEKYAKAYQCLKAASKSDTGAEIGIPDILSLAFHDDATYAVDNCKEEIDKFNSEKFIVDVKDAFDKGCGEIVLDSYRICKIAEDKSAQGMAPQSLTCSSSQSGSQLFISTKYVVGEDDQKSTRKIRSVKGIKDLKCEIGNTYAGLNTPSLILCELPNNYKQSGQAIVKIGNGKTCAVKVEPAIIFDISALNKYRCSNIYDKLLAKRTDGTIPSTEEKSAMSLGITLVTGMCEVCVSKNTNTGKYDNRPAEQRFASCVIWAAREITKSQAVWCHNSARAQHPATHPSLGWGNEAQNCEAGSFGVSLDGVCPQSVYGYQPNLLCANFPIETTVLKLNGRPWENSPIDFMNDAAIENDPVVKEVMKVIHENYPTSTMQ